MGKTLRKDKNGKTYNESLYKREAYYRCRCEYCLGKKDTADKIAEKELKTEIKNMDVSKVEKDENKRQSLISAQVGDCKYNETTGVYKVGNNVYDLTKTNGEPGLGYPPIRGEIINYKTVHENKQYLEQFYDTTVKPCKKGNKEGCICDGSCKYSAEKFEYKYEDYYVRHINNLDRFTPLSDGQMLEDLEGEYVLVSSVLNLFSAQK